MDRIRNRQRGFTLVELVVVIAILGLLAGIIVPTVSNVTSTARGSQKDGDRGAVSTAATNYESDQNSKPVSGTAPTKPVRNTTGDTDKKIIVRIGTTAVTGEDVTCSSVAECLGSINFAALLSTSGKTYLSELPAHSGDTIEVASGTPSNITGVNKNGDAIELHYQLAATATIPVWNMDSDGNVLILKSDNDYGK